MHGVRRGSRPSAEVIEQERERSAFLADLIRRALTVRKKPLRPPFGQSFLAGFDLVQRALEANPDEYTLWAYRREALLAQAKHRHSIDGDWKSELELTTRALRRHPKAYPAWQHRLWLLGDGASALRIPKDLRKEAIDQEEALSALMLSRDCRNFHGWAHRMRVRSIVARQNPSEKESSMRKELDFVEGKINEEFANYSAWHHRSALLPRVHAEGPEKFLSEELHFVRQAFYTEPDVQSAWFYHRWLLGGAPARGMKAVVVNRVLEEELSACEELLAVEPEARYALQTRVHLLLSLNRGAESLDALESLERLVSRSVSEWIGDSWNLLRCEQR